MSTNNNITNILKFLSQTSRILSQSVDREELLSLILQEALLFSQAEMASLVMQDHQGNPKSIYTLQKDATDMQSFSPQNYTFESRDEILSVCVNLADDNSWRVFFRDNLDTDYTCRLRMPLFYRSKWSGYLDVYAHDCDTFPEEDQDDYLKLFADSISLALENTFLNEYAQKKALENKLLIDTSLMLAKVLELDEVLEAISKALKLVVEYDGISIYLVTDDDNLEAIYWQGYGGDSCKDILMTRAGEGLVGWVANGGQGLVVDDVREDDRYICARDATRSELLVPIKLKDKIIGVFNIESDHKQAYHHHDLDLLSTFAAKSAIAIERAQLYEEIKKQQQLESEISIARDIQQTFLPNEKLFLEGFDIAGKNRSSRQVGGDYYDFIKIEEGQTGLVIADVVGKGVPAALIMASFRASLIAEIRNNYAIRAIMKKVNRLLTESLDGGNFVTAVYGVLDSRSKIFTFSNAGHNPPILLKKDGDVVELTDGGLAFGIKDEVRYEERPISLNSGDILVFFTDGVTEAQDYQSDQFETERMIEVIRENADRPAAEIVKLLIEKIIAFKAADFILDDLTIMILKVN